MPPTDVPEEQPTGYSCPRCETPLTQERLQQLVDQSDRPLPCLGDCGYLQWYRLDRRFDAGPPIQWQHR